MSLYRSRAAETDSVDSGALASGSDVLSFFLSEVGNPECVSSLEQHNGERLWESDERNVESRSALLENTEEGLVALTTTVEQLTPTVNTLQHRLDTATVEVNRLSETARTLESRLVTLVAALAVSKEERDKIIRRLDVLEAAVTRPARALEIGNGQQARASLDPRQVPESPLLVRFRSLRELTPEWKWSARYRILALAALAAIILIGYLLLRPMRTTVSSQIPVRLAASITLPASTMPPAPAPMVTKPEEEEVALNTVPTITAAPAERSRAQRVPAEPPAVRFEGTLSVQSEPSNAAVYVNQRPVGATPLQLPRLPAGSYAIWVEHESYQRWTAAVLVPAQKLTRLTVKLEPAAAQ